MLGAQQPPPPPAVALKPKLYAIDETRLALQKRGAELLVKRGTDEGAGDKPTRVQADSCGSRHPVAESYGRAKTKIILLENSWMAAKLGGGMPPQSLQSKLAERR
jgi:hypothetical protein